ncbi:ATP-binding cassette domain-containing protein, partial [Solemya velum gill symbiont]
MISLEARSLTKKYGQRTIVDNISTIVQQGEVVGLLGPNGAGKTTSFYMIVGLVSADDGEVILDGNDITTLPMHQRARRGIGYLSQEPSVFRRMSVEDNLLAILETRRELGKVQRE